MPAEAEAEPMEIDEQLFPVRPVPSWAQQIMAYLAEGKLPEDEAEARRIVGRSKGYTIINGEVYHRSATTVLQRCVEPEEGLEILREIHQGECGHHASSKALVAKAFRHGLYWPTAKSRCRTTGAEVPRVPALCKADSYSSVGTEDNPNKLPLLVFMVESTTGQMEPRTGKTVIALWSVHWRFGLKGRLILDLIRRRL